jgi:hypothetical protein
MWTMNGVQFAALVSLGLLFSVAPAIAECSVERAVSSTYMRSLDRVADLAKQQMAILPTLQRLNGKASDPNAPVGGQLSRQDLATFVELSHRLQAIQAHQILEAGQGRDAQIVGNIVSIATSLNLGRPIPRNSDATYFEKVLMVMRTASAKGVLTESEIEAPRTDTCELDGAIYLAEMSSVPQSASYRTPQQAVFATDLENLRGLWRTAELRYQTNTRDLTDSGGDVSSVGTTLANMQPGPDVEFFIDLLNDVATKYPSDYVKGLQGGTTTH